jgi:hypothetical protein
MALVGRVNQPISAFLPGSQKPAKTPFIDNDARLCPTGCGCKQFFQKSYSGDIPFPETAKNGDFETNLGLYPHL